MSVQFSVLCFMLVLLLAGNQAVPKPTTFSGPLQLENTSVRAFTPSEFTAGYELMVQYRHGSVPSCPHRIQYTGTPTEEDSQLLLKHTDMKISESDTLNPINCTDNGVQRLALSTKLRGQTLADFVEQVDKSLDKSILYKSVAQQLSGARYYVSVEDSVRVCGQGWFSSAETYFFFDESKLVQLQVVKKVIQDDPVVITLPLIGNIRYMVVAREGTTCIYRVESDVQSIIRNSPRPSDSPSVTPSPSPSTSPIPPSASASPSISASQSPTPSLSASPSITSSASMPPTKTPTPSLTPSMSNSPSVSTVPSPSASVTTSASAAPSPSASMVPTPSSSSVASPSPSGSSSVLPAPSSSASISPSVSASASSSASASMSFTSSPSPSSSTIPSSPSASSSQSVSPSNSVTPTASLSESPLPSSTTSMMPSMSSSQSVGPSTTPTTTMAPSVTASSSSISLPSATPTTTATPSVSISVTDALPTPTISASNSPSASYSVEPSSSTTATPSSSASPLISSSASASPLISSSASASPLISSSVSASPLLSSSASASPSGLASPSISAAVPSASVSASQSAASPSVVASSTAILESTSPSMTGSPSFSASAPMTVTPIASQTVSTSPKASVQSSATTFPSPSETPKISISQVVSSTSPSVSMSAGTLSASPTISLTPSPSSSQGNNDENNIDGDDRGENSVDGSSTCFPASAKVRTRNGYKKMEDLRMGEEVVSDRGLERIMLFTHENKWIRAEFVRLYAGNESLTATGGHMIYVRNGLRRAREVEVGDMLRKVDGDARVWKKEWVIERGLFNPHTEGGNIVVNGFVTSCYTESVETITAHVLLSVVRLLGRWRRMARLMGALGSGIEYMARFCGTVARTAGAASSALA